MTDMGGGTDGPSGAEPDAFGASFPDASPPPPPPPPPPSDAPPPQPPYGAPPYGAQPYGSQPYGTPPPYGAQPPYGAPPPYGVPGYGQLPPAKATNGLCIASLVLGILWVFGVGAILAVIFGFIGRRQVRDSGGTQGGDGLAIAGIVLGLVGIIGMIAWIALIVAFANTIDDCFNNNANPNNTTCINTGNSDTVNSGASGSTGSTGNTGAGPIGGTGTGTNALGPGNAAVGSVLGPSVFAWG